MKRNDQDSSEALPCAHDQGWTWIPGSGVLRCTRCQWGKPSFDLDGNEEVSPTIPPVARPNDVTPPACEKAHHLSPNLRCTLRGGHEGVCMYSIDAVLAACVPPVGLAANVKLAEAIVSNNADTADLIAFVSWVANHPDIGDPLTAVDREKDMQQKARDVLAGRLRAHHLDKASPAGPRHWSDEVCAIAHTLGIEYTPEGGATHPGPLRDILRAIKDLQRKDDLEKVPAIPPKYPCESWMQPKLRCTLPSGHEGDHLIETTKAYDGFRIAERTDYAKAVERRSLVQFHCPQCGVWCGEDRDFPCRPGMVHDWQTHVGVTFTCSCGDETYHRCHDALARHLADQRIDSAKAEP